MFNNSASIQEIIPRLAKQADIKYIYIGEHGTDRSIKGTAKNRITWMVVQNLLEKVNARQLYFWNAY